MKSDDASTISKNKDDEETDPESPDIKAESEDNELEGHNMDAIADVVKATLANQTGKSAKHHDIKPKRISCLNIFILCTIYNRIEYKRSTSNENQSEQRHIDASRSDD